MNVRENVAGDVLDPLTTMQWNIHPKAWTGGAPMAEVSLCRRTTVRLGPNVAFAQIGIVGFDRQIELEALRLYGLPEAAPVLVCRTPRSRSASGSSRRRSVGTCRTSRRRRPVYST
jgi:hypothetical protein